LKVKLQLKSNLRGKLMRTGKVEVLNRSTSSGLKKVSQKNAIELTKP